MIVPPKLKQKDEIRIIAPARSLSLLSEDLIKLASCESSLNPNAQGDQNTSFGLFQFKKTTWQEECEGDIWEVEDQVDCAAKLIKKGEGARRWKKCWEKLL